MQLYPDQIDVVERTRAAYARGRRAPVIVAPTGFGKAILASYIMAGAVAKGGRPLFIADRCTLLDQLVAKLAMAGITAPRVIQADRDDGPPDAAVTVASAPTLRLASWVDRLPEASLLIWDEAHHCSANTYRALIQRFPRALRLGLTATPARGDNRPLDMFDELIVGPSVAALTKLGRLAPCRVIAPKPLRPGELARTPLDAWRTFAAGRRAAIFRTRVSEAAADVSDFRAAGLRAEAVTAKTPNRAEILSAFAAGELDAVASVGVLTEGWDDPGCAVAIVACQPGHVARWLQICGRVLRYQPGKQALVVDLGGAVHEHGHPAEERTYSLDGRGIAPLPRDSIRQCGECGSVAIGRPTACPYCGAEWPIGPARRTRVVGADLEEVTVGAPRREYVVSIVAKRGGLCARCGRGIQSGDRIFWATVAKRARHQRCPAEAAGVTP